jgi:hypothetical protein
VSVTCIRAETQVPPGVGQRLKPRRNIHAVAKDVATLDDDVTLVDTYAELYARVRSTSAAQRSASTTLANSARIPGGFDDPTDKSAYRSAIPCRLDAQ